MLVRSGVPEWRAWSVHLRPYQLDSVLCVSLGWERRRIGGQGIGRRAFGNHGLVGGDEGWGQIVPVDFESDATEYGGILGAKEAAVQVGEAKEQGGGLDIGRGVQGSRDPIDAMTVRVGRCEAVVNEDSADGGGDGDVQPTVAVKHADSGVVQPNRNGLLSVRRKGYLRPALGVFGQFRDEG